MSTQSFTTDKIVTTVKFLTCLARVNDTIVSSFRNIQRCPVDLSPTLHRFVTQGRDVELATGVDPAESMHISYKDFIDSKLR